VQVTVPDGSLCNLNLRFKAGLPPDAVYNIIIDPGNQRVFKNNKVCIDVLLLLVLTLQAIGIIRLDIECFYFAFSDLELSINSFYIISFFFEFWSRGLVIQFLLLVPVVTVSGGLSSKPAVTVFFSLASKLVMTVSPGLTSKPAIGFLVEPQN
jgi:hypothetical protein